MMETLPTEQQQASHVATAAPRPGQDLVEREPVDILEEYHRYLYASRFTKNRRVLDVACGIGHGPALVSLNAESVLAIGADNESVSHASQKFGEFQNLRFETGTYGELRIHPNSYDIAICFELLATLAPDLRPGVMESVKRALLPGGMLLVSVPIRSSDAAPDVATGGAELPAFSGVELFEFLKGHFQHVRFIGQKPLTLSAMWSLHEWQDDLFRFHMRDDLFALPRSVEMFAEPGRVVALCSEEAISPEIVNNSKSVYFDSAQMARAARLAEEIRSLRTDLGHSRTFGAQVADERDTFRDAIAVLTNENLTHITKLGDVQGELEEQAARAVALEQELAARTAALTQQLEAKTTDVEALQRAHAEQASWTEALGEENAQLQARAQELEQKLAGRTAELEELQRTYAEQSVWTERLSGEHALLQSRAQELERRAEEASLHATAAGEENASLRERVQLLHRRVEEMTGQLTEVTGALEELRPRLSDAEHRYQRMLESTSESEAAKEFLAAQVQEMQAVLDEKIRATAELTSTLAGRDARIAELERAMESRDESGRDADAERVALRERVAELESREGAEKTQAATLVQDNQKLRARLYELQKQFDERASAARNSGQENEKLAARVAALQKSLEEKSALVLVTNQELSALKEKIQATQADYENKLQQSRQWEVTNKKRLEQYNDLHRRCDEQGMTIREMKIDSEKQAAAFETFQKSQADVQQRYNRSQIRVQELQQQVAILEQKLDQIGKSGLVKTLSKLGLFSGGDA